jgi:hypothetical protein
MREKILPYILGLFAILTFAGCTSSKAPEENEIAIKVSTSYSPIKGQLETPSGGKANTTSKNRPTLDELGIKRAHTQSAEIGLKRNKHTFFIKGEQVRLSGESTLEKDLMTRNIPFEKGDTIFSSAKLDTYLIGASKELYNKNGTNLSAGVHAALLDFDYEAHTRDFKKDTKNRSYMKVGAGINGKAETPITNKLLLWANGFYSLPIKHTPWINELATGVKYKLIDDEQMKANLSIGVGLKDTSFEDSQEPEKNHIRAKRRPELKASFEVKFK